MQNNKSIILKYPFPFKAWFTIANDPDNTLIKDWIELNDFIWKQLNLPIGNSLFIKSYNQNLPQQVNLFDNPEIAAQQYHDTIHTWGDYMHSKGKGFSREDATEAIEILHKNNINPKIWIDHARFTGNLLHNSNYGAIPETKDASGIVYKNFSYTLDLIEEAGIKYIWNGGLCELPAQDSRLTPWKYFSHVSNSKLTATAKYFLHLMLRHTRFGKWKKITVPGNQAYYKHKFPDGRNFYLFRRYGTWKDADIYGLANIISPAKIDSLMQTGGTCAAYTHLGKRPFNKMEESFHIPAATRICLENIAEKYRQRLLMVSPLSDMLDYLVLRDNIKINKPQNKIQFNPDGIRYKKVSAINLKGKKFSFYSAGFDMDNLKIDVGSTPSNYNLVVENEKIFSIQF